MGKTTATDSSSSSSSSERLDVYFHCESVDMYQLWFHVEFGPEEDKEKEESIVTKWNLVGKLPNFVCGEEGGWTVYGKDIYYTGGCKWHFIVPELFKHNIYESSALEEWIVVGSKPPLVLGNPFVATDVANKKLYIVGGKVDDPDNDNVDGPCGQVYDLVTKTWTLLDGDISKLTSYNAFYEASVVLKDDEESIGIVFYKARDGCMQFVDAAGAGETDEHDEFVFPHPSKPLRPPGLRNCIGTEYCTLRVVSHSRPAVVIDGTFYWFNVNMCLYGYDSKAKTWIKSKCLLEYFPKPFFDDQMELEFPLSLGFSKRKMLVIFPTAPKELTFASLVIEKTNDNLLVVVETTRPYCIDYHGDLLLLGVKAMLKNP